MGGRDSTLLFFSHWVWAAQGGIWSQAMCHSAAEATPKHAVLPATGATSPLLKGHLDGASQGPPHLTFFVN